MPKVKTIEKQIWDREGFAPRITHLNGRDVRGDRSGLPSYDFERAAKNSWTANRWKARRFRSKYPGFGVEVLDGNGQAVPGNRKLGSVRDSYLEDE